MMVKSDALSSKLDVDSEDTSVAKKYSFYYL